MYPNLYYAFKDIFGLNLPGLRFVNSFGFFVALGFLAAAWVLTKELKRKERAGLLTGKETKILVGQPASIPELLLNFILGFILGYKIIGLFMADKEQSADPQSFIFSGQGNLPMGLILGLLFAGLKYWEKNKQKLPKPEERTIRIWPHDRVGDLVIYAALFGFLGAKIFHNLENWNEFVKSPIEALLSFSGLTFYGGLICAALAIYWYAKRHNIGFKHLADAAAPGLLLAYAVGRIGCQVAGDGDWGILNSAYVTGPDSKAVLADSATFNKTLDQHKNFFLKTFNVSSLDQVHHKSVVAPSWLPDWMVAYSYPHNVISEGVAIPGCTEDLYCAHLPVPVFPTPFYETSVCLIFFFILWAFRKRLSAPGSMFAVYLIVNGIERFLVEKIRVNTKYDIGGFHPTQAELISTGLVLAGVALYLYVNKKKKAVTA
ncbi:MAG: prolipoprotein diacylglyceryl transferase [Pseudobacter sp.]|uniref:prolipoprotein diacylglyceryl transferase n=1 Tax=Pseudobacter sp. TaxID=2045420 RepID=UPI003F810903